MNGAAKFSPTWSVSIFATHIQLLIKVVKKHATFSTIYLFDPQTEVKVKTPDMYRCSSSEI